ncbi:hypothetical protein Tco_1173515 [Tanacetum coccineum]
MPPRMTTRSAGQVIAAPRGGRTGGRTGKGGGRTRGRSGNQGNGGHNGQGVHVGGQGTEVKDGVDEVPDFSTVIAQQLQNLLPTILAQVGNQGSNLGKGRNQNGDVVNDNIRGDVRNVIENDDRRSCTYKEFLACNPKEYDGKGGAIVYTRWGSGRVWGSISPQWSAPIRSPLGIEAVLRRGLLIEFRDGGRPPPLNPSHCHS